MILEPITAAACGSTGIVGTSGASVEAQLIAKQLAEGRQSLRKSYTWGGASSDAFRSLSSIFAECRFPNWDGYGAARVSVEAILYAGRFLRTMPLGTPVPDVGIEPDGHVTLDWQHSAYRTLSVSVSPEGDLHYSALLGPNKAYGTEAFLGDIPKIILDLIRRIHAA